MIKVGIWMGIVIGGAGGTIAGLTVWLVDYVHKKVLERRDKRHIYKWLQSNTRDEDGHRYRSTRAIASWTNLTQFRVRYICSTHDRIYLSTGEKEDMWSIYGHGNRSVYENHGLRSI